MLKILLCTSPTDGSRTEAMLRGRFEVKTVAGREGTPDAVAFREVLNAATAFSPDVLLISDRAYVKGSSENVRKLKKTGTFPVILLADAENYVPGAIAGTGCDDFLFPSVREGELCERITIVCGRAKKDERFFVYEKLTVDPDACRVTVSGEEVHLTMIEYKLLCMLVRNRGRVMTYDELIEGLWMGRMGNEITSLRVFVTTLRKKISSASGGENYIQTHVGIGYCIP